MDSVFLKSQPSYNRKNISVLRINVGHDDPKNAYSSTPIVDKSSEVTINSHLQDAFTWMHGEEPPAVVVRNVTKRYESKGPPVLDNFCMNVQKGSIYSLLGSSGCGKTTALTCIIGTKKIDSGSITVFGARPGTKECGIPGRRVGYMPQDIALYHDFSIREMILYYGTLYGMPSSEIAASKDLLIALLELPKESRRIASLSGGQKRRVSLAVSLIHSPELLVLDEPTVGVDPLLRESIWKHLCNLVSSQNTTVIITTHYIEEARQSKTVGLMRGGRILIENNPETLIQEYGTTLLEDVVLKLCRKDKLAKQSMNNNSCLPEPIETVATSTEVHQKNSVTTKNVATGNWMKKFKVFEDSDDFKSSMARVKALTKKNVVVMMRNLILFMFLIIIPGMQLSILCLTVGNDPIMLSMGFVNKEKIDIETCLVPIKQPRRCNLEGLSCNYLTKLPKHIVNLISYETEVAARAAVEAGTIWGFMSFPEGYSFSIYARAAGLALNGSMEASQIFLEMDMSNKQIALTLKRVFYEAYQTYISQLLSNCGFPAALGESPLKYLTPIYGDEDTDFSTFVAPSSLLGAIFFFSLCSSSISFIWDKKQGTLERAMVAGVRYPEILTAYFLTEGCILFGQLAIVFPMLIGVYGVVIRGSSVLALTLTVLMGLSGASMGFLIASVCNEEMEAVLLAMAAYFPTCLLSGTLWPIEGLPVGLKYFAYLLPCTLANTSIRSIVSRGQGLSHANVWPGFLNTIFFTIFYLWMSQMILRRSLAKK